MEGVFDKERVRLTSCLIFHYFSPDLIFILGNQLFTDVIDVVNVIIIWIIYLGVDSSGKSYHQVK